MEQSFDQGYNPSEYDEDYEQGEYEQRGGYQAQQPLGDQVSCAQYYKPSAPADYSPYNYDDNNVYGDDASGYNKEYYQQKEAGGADDLGAAQVAHDDVSNANADANSDFEAAGWNKGGFIMAGVDNSTEGQSATHAAAAALVSQQDLGDDALGASGELVEGYLDHSGADYGDLDAAAAASAANYNIAAGGAYSFSREQNGADSAGGSLSMDQSSLDAPRRMMQKGRKNKDEANELVRRAKLLPKVMGVRYDANHQYWVATWYQNRKRMDRYFSVGRFGFEEARLLAIDCRKTAGKSLQGKSYGRPNYSGKDLQKSRSFDLDPTKAGASNSDYYASAADAKKTKDFNRLNVSKVALNYILSDLCNNCLPTILENNHMPGELYIHCYNKISDHLQMIITANQSEEIEKYLHLFQLCIQNRVLPSALQVQEQRAMITALCQM